ncbi:MAG: ABC transporter permease, partial [Aeromonadaceae bacterium]
SGSGALLGLLLGYLCVLLAALLWPTFPAQVPLLATLISPLAAVATGLLFSWLPARQAAGREPVASLRGGQL